MTVLLQSAKTACAAALENAEGVREALKTKDVLEAAQKSSTAAYRAHSVRMTFLGCSEHCKNQRGVQVLVACLCAGEQEVSSRPSHPQQQAISVPGGMCPDSPGTC